MNIFNENDEWMIIAEKPSVAGHIVNALAHQTGMSSTKYDGYYKVSNYIVTWAFGHLLSLVLPEDYDPTYKVWKMEKYPILPEEFKYVPVVNKKRSSRSAHAQLQTIINLATLPSVKGYVMATDYDREGQLIGEEILSVCPLKPCYRMLLNEWTQPEVINSLSNLLNNTTEPELIQLRNQGYNRQHIDWLIGMNYTPIFSLAMSAVKDQDIIYNMGRVIMPTLKILYDQNRLVTQTRHIRYLNIIQDISTSNGRVFPLSLKHLDNNVVYNSEVESANFIQHCTKYKYIVEESTSIVETNAPRLFSLTSLQRHILGKYKGFSADKVSRIAQKLYEKGLISYPRTESTYLDNSLFGKVCGIINNLKKAGIYPDLLAAHRSPRVFNSARVKSHSAIIPTVKSPTIGELSDEESLIYMEIQKRFISNFMPPSIVQRREIKLRFHEDYLKEYSFKGNVDHTIYKGWNTDGFEPQEQPPTNVVVDNSLDGAIFIKDLYSIDDHINKPYNFTESQLLALMESCGSYINLDDEGLTDKEVEMLQDSIDKGFSLGTSATRADIIKKLLQVGYVNYMGNKLTITRKGKDVIEFFPLKELLEPNHAGLIESKILTCTNKEIVSDVIGDINKITDIFKNQMSVRESIGRCPICDYPILDGKISYGCTNYDNCRYHIKKSQSNNKVKITLEQAISILKNKPTEIDNIKYRYTCDKDGNDSWILH